MNADQTELARAAWRKYGKGNHPAGLNIGGCYAYALAKYSGEPLLFKVLVRAFELLADFPDDFLAEGRQNLPSQHREGL